MSVFEALLRLQEHDTTIDQIEHRLSTLPEREQVETVLKSLAAVQDEEAVIRVRRDEIAREQKRLEDEAALVEAHADDIHKKLYGGTITSPKELQAFQADYDALKRRQTDLEDQVIVQMEAAEPVDAELDAVIAKRSALEAESAAAADALAAAETSTAAELAAAQAARAPIMADVSEAQLTRYEKLRPLYSGIAVAKLVGAQCGGCHLTLSAVALDRIHKLPEDALVECEECGRILVR
jgi:predicted  nucleic acid-binding Zn-ribbon protein